MNPKFLEQLFELPKLTECLGAQFVMFGAAATVEVVFAVVFSVQEIWTSNVNRRKP